MSQTSTIGRTATTVHTNPEGMTQVTYHSTAVVSFNAKRIILNHGGWMTHTTKTRMNQASNQFSLGYQVRQKDFNWYVDYKGQTVDFDDRIIELTR